MSLVCNVHPDAELLAFGHVAPRQQLLLHLPGGGAPVVEDVLVAHPLAQQEVGLGWAGLGCGWVGRGWARLRLLLRSV
jgi:hypothetical protein